MKRWVIGFAVVPLVAFVAGLGYLGFRSSAPPESQAAVAPPTVAVGRGDVQQTVTAPGQLSATRETVLSSGVAGRISNIGVHPGDKVKEGDVLVQIDDTDLQYSLQTAQSTLASAQAKLRQLNAPPAEADVNAAQAQVTSAQAAYDAAVAKNGHSDDQITAAKAQLDKAAITLQTAQAAYDKVAWRGDIEASPQAAALQQATIDYQAAQANYEITLASINDSAVKAAAQALAQAQASLAKLTSPASPEDLAVAEANVNSAQVAVNQAENKLKQTAIVAPFDGIVEEVTASPGQAVSTGAGLVKLLDPKALEVRATVTEEDYPLVQVGQEAKVYLDARPDIVAHGKISQVVPLRESGSSPLYPIYVALDDLPDDLAPGMTVDSSILIAKQSAVVRLPKSLVHARADGTAPVKVWANGQVENRTIKVGLRGDQYIEVQDGLHEGELVVSQ